MGDGEGLVLWVGICMVKGKTCISRSDARVFGCIHVGEVSAV